VISSAVIGVVGREYAFVRRSRSAGLQGIRFDPNAHDKKDRHALLIRFIVAADPLRPFLFAVAIPATT
jgi:hypothetical protein